MTALIILAAGQSSRLGFDKQTLLYKGKTLLEMAVEAGLKSKCRPVTVVLGANADKIEPGLRGYPVNIIHNSGWEAGMSSSIAAAIKHIETDASVDQAVVMLCDQPFVTNRVIDNLLYTQQQTGRKIVACTYNDTIGVPALFNRSLFTELINLNGHDGAKSLISKYIHDIATIQFDKGAIDIDTIADYEKLIGK